jgi:hypothetical protein
LLQVDNQTKGFFPTPEAAHSAGLKIKKSFPRLQVAIYDSVTNSRILVTVPIATKYAIRCPKMPAPTGWLIGPSPRTSGAGGGAPRRGRLDVVTGWSDEETSPDGPSEMSASDALTI